MNVAGSEMKSLGAPMAAAASAMGFPASRPRLKQALMTPARRATSSPFQGKVFDGSSFLFFGHIFGAQTSGVADGGDTCQGDAHRDQQEQAFAMKQVSARHDGRNQRSEGRAGPQGHRLPHGNPQITHAQPEGKPPDAPQHTESHGLHGGRTTAREQFPQGSPAGTASNAPSTGKTNHAKTPA